MKELSFSQMEVVTGGLTQDCVKALAWYGVIFVGSAALTASVVGGIFAGIGIAKAIINITVACKNQL